MLQSILFFVLGFLCSAFLALMVAPAIWRRAVVLTRKRIEAAVPLSVAEIQADKDRMRAEMAMTIRRLEMKVKSLREKSAAQAIEIARGREELKRLATERDGPEGNPPQSHHRSGEPEAAPEGHGEQLDELAAKLAHAEKALKTSALELERIGKLYEEATFAASSRQIELVARESQVETLSGKLAELRTAVEEAGLDRQPAYAEEDRRTEVPERAGEGLPAVVKDGEAALDRREKRPAQPPEALNGERAQAGFPEAQGPGPKDPVPEETKVLLSMHGGEEFDAAVAKLSAARERLQDRLTAAGRENRKPNEVRPASARSGLEVATSGREDALLRDEMNDLAAEVIRLSAQLDGPGSPILLALSGAAAGETGGGAVKVTSLADRVRAQQEAAAAE